MSELVRSAVWQRLLQHKAELAKQSLGDIVLSDAKRLEHCQLKCEGLRFNYALQYATPTTLDLLLALAQQQKIEDARMRMWRGGKINNTENRAVLHVALRQKNGSIVVDGQDILPEVRAARAQMAAFAEKLRQGSWKGATGKTIKHVVNIGIGGSDLGPRLAVKALSPYADGPTVHFTANVDAFDLLGILKNLDPAESLFVVVSKTFTTQETLMNARLARQWLVDALGDAAVSKHFVAVSGNKQAVADFGIGFDNLFPMWDWVGGRYSLWSAVGLSIMLAIGPQGFDALCDGAAAMDAHFKTAPLAQNIPVIMALLGVWQRDFLDAAALAILPYEARLAELPRFLQQLDMESNGKSVTCDGDRVDYKTGPLIFGEPGTVGQHSFYQWLHQGTDKIAVDFIGVAQDDLSQPAHHDALLAHMVAQAGAFAFGRPEAAKPHEVYAGNRSSNLIMLDRLDPYHLGLLLALYEHKIFVQGMIWDINSFDQPGVELGKQMAKALESPSHETSSQASFIASLRRWAKP